MKNKVVGTVKDYDIDILYHLGKANMEIHALNRKTTQSSALIIRQRKHQKEMQRADIEIIIKGITTKLVQLTVQPTPRKRIIDAQGKTHTSSRFFNT